MTDNSYFPVGITLEGGRNLRRTLKKAGSDLSELKDAHAAAAGVVANRALGTAPRVSGGLAATVRTGASKTAGTVRAGNNRKSKTGVPYAGVIHWGWPARGIAAQPWLSEAAQSTEPRWVRAYFDKVNDALAKVKGI